MGRRTWRLLTGKAFGVQRVWLTAPLVLCLLDTKNFFFLLVDS